MGDSNFFPRCLKDFYHCFKILIKKVSVSVEANVKGQAKVERKLKVKANEDNCECEGNGECGGIGNGPVR